MRQLYLSFLIGVLGAGAASAERVEYEYDVHGRLVKVERCGADEDCATNADDTTTDYIYDDVDNRTSKEVATPPH